MKAILLSIILCCSFTVGFSQQPKASVSVSDVVLLDFRASWCGYCQRMAPLVKHISDAGGTVQHIDVDVEHNMVHQFAVRGVPCYVLLVKGKEVGRINGATTYFEFQKLFAKIYSIKR